MKLHEKLKALDTYPFHMPGHKRNGKFGIVGSEIDITEIEGFDNLHSPEGVLLELENRLSGIYKSKRSFLSVGGSTLGILCAVLALTERGDKILIARNCHKSVYNACILNGLRVVYIEPEFDGINACYTSVMQDVVDRALSENPDAKALVITSPTYEGRISNIVSKIPLIVDAAHGAHLGLADFPAYPKGSIVVSSLHKTLPALTQTAVINVYCDEYIYKVKRYVDILETSSPSYVLMNSVSVCCDIIEKQPELFREYYKRLSDFREISLDALRLKYSDDISKIVISTENTQLSGSQLAEILREKYKLEAEMASLNYIVLMTSVGDGEEAFERLGSALIELDGELTLEKAKPIKRPPVPKGVNEIKYVKSTVKTDIGCTVGKTCAEFIYAYPPDAPLIAPNEIVTAEALGYLKMLYDSGVKIVSDSALFPKSILTKADE